jgi:hypothetical protein
MRQCATYSFPGSPGTVTVVSAPISGSPEPYPSRTS